MTAADTAQRYATIYNSGQADKLAALYAEGGVLIHPLLGRVEGRESIRQAERPLFDAFSDVTMTIGSIVAQDDCAAVEWCVEARHTSALPLPTGGMLPPTGRRVETKGVSVLRFDDSGLVTEEHRYFDGMAMMQQLGITG